MRWLSDKYAKPKLKNDVVPRKSRTQYSSPVDTENSNDRMPPLSMRLLWKMRDPRSSSDTWIKPEKILGLDAYIPVFSRIVIPRGKESYFDAEVLRITKKFPPITFELEEPVSGCVHAGTSHSTKVIFLNANRTSVHWDSFKAVFRITTKV